MGRVTCYNSNMKIALILLAAFGGSIAANINGPAFRKWSSCEDIPEDHLLPTIKIRDELVKYKQDSFYGIGGNREQTYALYLARGPGDEQEFVYIQQDYPQDVPISVCDLQYGSYQPKMFTNGVFFVYHNRTQEPYINHFRLNSKGIDQEIKDAINQDTDSDNFPGTSGGHNFWNYDWTLGYKNLKDTDCELDIPEDHLLPTIKIRDEHVTYKQDSFMGIGGNEEQNYTLYLARGPGIELELVYIQHDYPQDALISVCDLQYGSYQPKMLTNAVFFIYHNKTQEPYQKHFQLKSKGVTRDIKDAICMDVNNDNFPGTSGGSSFWNYDWLYGYYNFKDIYC